ncbi:uncharacterized protein LOC144447687 [Glandiceps talaboti]
MEISQDPKALELLLHHLEDRQPESLPMYNLVRHVRDRKLEKAQVFVDDRNIKNCTTVLCLGLNVSLGTGSDDSGWYLYSEDEDSLVSMLNTVKLTERSLGGFSQSDMVTFLCLDDKFLKTVTQYMNKQGYQIELNYTFRLYVRKLDKATIESMKKDAQSLPKGFTMAPLRPEHANLVTSKTIYSTPSTAQFVRKMIEEFPSIAIYPPNQGEPVAWSVLMQHGEPGYGYTHPEYRNKKFAQIRQAELMSRLLDYGYKAVCIATEDDNTAMQKVFKKYPGLQPLNLIHYSVFKKSPNMSTTSKL